MERSPLVLVIDDEIGMCKTLKDILTDRGYIVETAYTAQEGLAKCAHSPPDLAILDLRLPDGDGLELIPQLHRLAPQAKFLVITAYGQGRRPALEQPGLSLLGYLEKPLDLERALELIDRGLASAGEPSEAWLLRSFGQRLRQLRRERHLTQAALARRTGLNQGYISDLERGKRNISLRSSYRLARALKVRLEELFRLDLQDQDRPGE
jgi:DNA-binding NtrC family response regulator